MVPFLRNATGTIIANEAAGLTERILNEHKRMKCMSSSKYVDLNYIPPVTSTVERAFSRASLVTGLLRQSLSEERLGNIMMLSANRDLWGINEVGLHLQNL